MSFTKLSAKPEPIHLAKESSAVIVNDMQNAFCSKGGYLDRIGFNIDDAEAVIEAVARVLKAARHVGLPVFHSQNGFYPDLRDVPVDSPWWYKSPALKLARERPELSDEVMIEGTWDYEFVERVAPIGGELIIRKSRPSCFAGTNLDQQLRARGVNTIIVLGIASNVGVEWTLREALSHEYFGVMVHDATMPAGSRQIHDAVLFNIEQFVGWTTTCAEFENACKSFKTDITEQPAQK